MKFCKFCSTALVKDVNWREVNYSVGAKVCHYCKLKKQREWREANPGAYKEWKYGLSQEAYDQLLIKQNHRCAICGTSSPGGRHNKFHIDHNHMTGKVRGLLCWSCNAGLGQFKDDYNLLLEAYTFLLKDKNES